MKIDLKPNEMVIKAGNSTFFNGHAVNGKLILTNQRIYFKSDQRNYDQEIEPSRIREVIPFKTGFFSDRGLNIVTIDGDEHNFKVKDRNSWCKLLNHL